MQQTQEERVAENDKVVNGLNNPLPENNAMRIVKIEPTYATAESEELSERLGICIVGGNMKDTAVFMYVLLDKNDFVQLSGNYTLDGENYLGWSSDDHYVIEKLIEQKLKRIKLLGA